MEFLPLLFFVLFVFFVVNKKLLILIPAYI
jgi:hypothetical protein